MAKRKNTKNPEFVTVTKKESVMYSQLLMGGALVSVLLALVGYMGADIWLASTQWLLVACVLALFGIYLKVMR